MIAPFLVMLLFLFLVDHQAHATKCPDLTLDEIVNDILYDSAREPQEDDEPIWYLLNEGDIRNISDIVVSEEVKIDKIDETPVYKSDENAKKDISDDQEDSPRFYCRYKISNHKKDKTKKLEHMLILFSEVEYISKKEREKLEKLEDMDTLPQEKKVIHRPPNGLLPIFLLANPHLITAYKMGLMVPLMLHPPSNQTNDKHDEADD